MEIAKLTRDNFTETVENAARLLRAGGVLVVPTDTVYGLAADFRNSAACRMIFEIKKRPAEKILPVFVSSLEMAEQMEPFTLGVEDILKKFWPGKLTAVLQSMEKPGLRVPDNKFLLTLIEALGGPIAETSANISGSPPHTNIGEVIAEFKQSFPRPDLVVDAGDLPDSLPSSVVDFTVMPPCILREGAISREELERISGMIYIKGA